MKIYAGTLIWILFIGIITRKINIELSDNRIGMRYTYLNALIMMAYLILFIGLRSAGADTSAYIKGYEQLPTGSAAIGEAFLEEEGLFKAFGIAIKTYISTDFQPYLFLISFISGAAVALAFKKATPYVTSSMILFVLCGYWSWMFNGCRQFLAVSLAFLATVYLADKKTKTGYVEYILIILILSGIHTSVLVLIPTYFIAQGEAFSKRTSIALIIAVFAVFFTSRFSSILSSALEDTSYGSILSGTYYNSDDGSSPIRTLIYAVPLALAYFDRRNILETAPKVIQLSVNMSFLCVCVSLIANVTSGIYMGRLAVYFSIYNLVLIPWLMHNSKIFADRQLLKSGLYVLYSAFFIYSNYIYSHIYYQSEFLGLTVG